jgi:hypothetical protein
MLNGKNHPEKSASVDFHLAKSRFRRQIDSNLFYPKIEFPIIKTQADLKAHGLEAQTTLIEAPTRAIECDGEHFEFYAVEKLADIDAVDLIIVDGPHGSRGILDRYPAIPLLYDKLQPGGVIIVDDAANFRESPDLMLRWQNRYPQLIREDLPTEKGTVIFRKPR